MHAGSNLWITTWLLYLFLLSMFWKYLRWISHEICTLLIWFLLAKTTEVALKRNFAHKKVKFRAYWEYCLCTCPVCKYLFKVNSKITRITFLDVFWVFLVLTLLVSLLVFCHSDSDLIWLKSWKESIIYLTSAYKIKYFEPTVSCDITWKNLTRSVCYGSLPCLIKAVKAVSIFF